MRVRNPGLQVVSTIRHEHRLMRAILESMLQLVRLADTYGNGINHQVMRTMTYYLDQFPERLHHPREDRYLFPAVLKRAPQIAAQLALLESEHAKGAQKMLELEQALLRFEAGGPTKFSQYRNVVEDYVKFYSAHMRAEEDTILPVAIEALTTADWKLLAEAFQAGINSPEGEFRALFTHIANITPAPMGFAVAAC
jgi:hemerythrin-like domain-containing protein